MNLPKPSPLRRRSNNDLRWAALRAYEKISDSANPFQWRHEKGLPKLRKKAKMYYG
jgi:hypothetical protein